MTGDLKIEILLFYYDRPKMAMDFAVASVLNSDYENWFLTVIDDSSDQNSEELIHELIRRGDKYSHTLEKKISPPCISSISIKRETLFRQKRREEVLCLDIAQIRR